MLLGPVMPSFSPLYPQSLTLKIKTQSQNQGFAKLSTFALEIHIFPLSPAQEGVILPQYYDLMTI